MSLIKRKILQYLHLCIGAPSEILVHILCPRRSFHMAETYLDRPGAGVARTGLTPSCRLARLGDGALNRRSEFFGH